MNKSTNHRKRRGQLHRQARAHGMTAKAYAQWLVVHYGTRAGAAKATGLSIDSIRRAACYVPKGRQRIIGLAAQAGKTPVQFVTDAIAKRGGSVTKTADALAVGLSTLYHYAQQDETWEPKRKPIPTYLKKKVVQMLTEGFRPRDIIRLTGVKAHSVYYYATIVRRMKAVCRKAL